MTRRPNAFAAVPLMKSRHWSTDMLNSGLEDSLTELVEIRASQINGCAFCLCMHSADARERGESAEHRYLLDTRRESPLYGERKRAALACTEALTLVSGSRPRGDVYRAVQARLTEQEQVTLSLLIVTINGWNPIQAGVRAVHPAGQREAASWR
jgi:AhpD family alkylhydroperoxidase